MKRVGRSTFRKVYWWPLLCMVVLLVLASAVLTAIGGPFGPLANLFFTALAGAFWVWLLLGRPIAYLLVPLLVSTVPCPGCGEEVDAVDLWDCPCGLRDHRERHVLAARCPLCGSTAGHVNCPRCGCTIMLW